MANTKLRILVLLLAIVALALAAPIRLGKTVTIDSKSVFCLLLPRQFGGDIAASENSAVSFCTKSTPNAPNANTLPKGFIKTVNYATGPGYVQITGRIDRRKYGLSPDDGGGQYDTKAPRGASCAGSKKFVQLIEPDAQLYCIRCCTDPKKCNTGISTKGCRVVIPGKY
ncbi:2787_t:CDS:1 [Paraglomus brasilianum]|uniref:2787_t:CDS:1 n=1 Tax=Paraglomus brasilianum TaxID=144538 RepID=A0A9N9BQ95_9GLOM|nr:2787_t:CDS:1 [Paraglomus brasilianum]